MEAEGSDSSWVKDMATEIETFLSDIVYGDQYGRFSTRSTQIITKFIFFAKLILFVKVNSCILHRFIW